MEKYGECKNGLIYDKKARFEDYDMFPMKFVDFYTQIINMRADMAERFLRMNVAQSLIKSINIKGKLATILNEAVSSANTQDNYLELLLLNSLPDRDGNIYLEPEEFNGINGMRTQLRTQCFWPFITSYYEILMRLIQREEKRRDNLVMKLVIYGVDANKTIAEINEDLEEMKEYSQEIDEETLPDPSIFWEHLNRVIRNNDALQTALHVENERQKTPKGSTPTRTMTRIRAAPKVSPVDPRTIRHDRGINVTFVAPRSPHRGVFIRIPGKMPREQSWITRTPPPPRVNDSLIKPVVKKTKCIGFPAEQHWVIRTPPPPRPIFPLGRFPLEQNWILRTPPPRRPTSRPPQQADSLDGNYTIIDDHIHGLDKSFPGNPNVTLGHIRDEDLDWSHDPYKYIDIPELGRRFRTRETWDDQHSRDYMASLNRHYQRDRLEPYIFSPNK